MAAGPVWGDLCAGQDPGNPGLRRAAVAEPSVSEAAPGSRRGRCHGHPAASRQDRGDVARRSACVLRTQPSLSVHTVSFIREDHGAGKRLRGGGACEGRSWGTPMQPEIPLRRTESGGCLL